MSFLSSIVGDAKQQIKAQGAGNAAVSGVTNAVQRAKNDIQNSARSAVQNALDQGVNSAVSAAKEALNGNLAGAASKILNAPQDIFDSVLSGLQGNSIFSPGTVVGVDGPASGSGGVPLGHALLGAQARTDPMMSYCWYAQMPIITPSQALPPSSNGTNFLAGLGNAAFDSLTANVPGVPGQLVQTFTGSMFGGSVASAQGNIELPWYYVEECTPPFRHFNIRSIFREGRDRHYADKYSVDNLRCGIYADSSNVALSYLQAWLNCVMNPFSAQAAVTDGGGFGRPVDYKKPIRIFLLDVQRSEIVILEYTECWPVNLDGLTLNSGSSERIIYQVNFSVGDMFINIIPVSDSYTSGIVANPSSFPQSINSALYGLGQDVFSKGFNLAKGAVSSLGNLF